MTDECKRLRKKFDLFYEPPYDEEMTTSKPPMQRFDWDTIIDTLIEEIGAEDQYPYVDEDLRSVKHKYHNNILEIYPVNEHEEFVFSLYDRTAGIVVRLLGPKRKLRVHHYKRKDDK